MEILETLSDSLFHQGAQKCIALIMGP